MQLFVLIRRVSHMKIKLSLWQSCNITMDFILKMTFKFIQ